MSDTVEKVASDLGLVLMYWQNIFIYICMYVYIYIYIYIYIYMYIYIYIYIYLYIYIYIYIYTHTILELVRTEKYIPLNRNAIGTAC